MSIINKNMHDLVIQTITFPYVMHDDFLDT